jgi:hypothetical protein
MEFRGTALLNVMSLCFSLFNEGSGLDCCRDRNLSPNVKVGYEVHTVFCPLEIGQSGRHLRLSHNYMGCPF